MVDVNLLPVNANARVRLRLKTRIICIFPHFAFGSFNAIFCRVERTWPRREGEKGPTAIERQEWIWPFVVAFKAGVSRAILVIINR